MRRFLRITVLAAVLALAAWPATAARAPTARPAQDQDGALVQPANFDDASFDDLAVGAPGVDVGAGGVAGAAEAGDRFGAAVA